MNNANRESAGFDGFAEFPDACDAPIGIEIVRTPAKGAFVGVILSEAALGRYTHFARGRSGPCGGQECPECLALNQRRWHSWLFVYSQTTSRTFLLELPAAAAHELANFRSTAGSLRGFVIKCDRLGGRPNSRVRVSIASKRVDLGMLPACPSLPEILARMWDRRDAGIQIESGPTLAVVGEREYAEDAEKRA